MQDVVCVSWCRLGSGTWMRWLFTSNAVPVICGPITNQPIEIAQDSFPHSQGLQMADATSGSDPLPVNMLIGADCYWTLVMGDMIKGGPSELVAMATKLGYALSGPVCGVVSDLSDLNTSLIATHVLKIATDVCSDTDMSADLRKFWEYEPIGILDKKNTLYDNLIDEIDFIEGRYQVKLQFKVDHPLLPDNYHQSKCRLISPLSRRKSKPSVLNNMTK